jgi:hypothetical protein
MVEAMNLGLTIALGGAAVLGVLLATRAGSAAETPEPQPPGPQPPGPEPVRPPEPKEPKEPVPPLGLVAGEILQTVGKHWILTNKIASGAKAANYGWHFKGSTFGGSKFEAAVSLPAVRVIQGIGTAHDRFHTDYSQTCVLASQACVYQGQDRLLSDLLTDPIASKLLSVEGPLQITRQPGVTQPEPMVLTPSVGVTRADVAALASLSIPSREATILSWVEQGFAEYAWADITVGDLTFHVFTDALQFGGVRINASATLMQQIADRMSCSLLTARMADLVFEAASKIILPFPMTAGPQMASIAYMLAESDKISAAAGVLWSSP